MLTCLSSFHLKGEMVKLAGSVGQSVEHYMFLPLPFSAIWGWWFSIACKVLLVSICLPTIREKGIGNGEDDISHPTPQHTNVPSFASFNTLFVLNCLSKESWELYFCGEVGGSGGVGRICNRILNSRIKVTVTIEEVLGEGTHCSGKSYKIKYAYNVGLCLGFCCCCTRYMECIQ